MGAQRGAQKQQPSRGRLAERTSYDQEMEKKISAELS
jgi:hypothetical protein